jgi:hypothetical protein
MAAQVDIPVNHVTGIVVEQSVHVEVPPSGMDERTVTEGVQVFPPSTVPPETADVAVMTGEPATWVSLVDQTCSTPEVQPLDDGMVQRLRGAKAVCDVRFNDARVSGTATAFFNYDCQAEAGCLTWGHQEIVGPDGGWSGSFEGLIDPTFTERTVAVLRGTGSHTGMTFVVMAVAPLDAAPSGGLTRGAILYPRTSAPAKPRTMLRPGWPCWRAAHPVPGQRRRCSHVHREARVRDRDDGRNVEPDAFCLQSH